MPSFVDLCPLRMSWADGPLGSGTSFVCMVLRRILRFAERSHCSYLPWPASALQLNPFQKLTCPEITLELNITTLCIRISQSSCRFAFVLKSSPHTHLMHQRGINYIFIAYPTYSGGEISRDFPFSWKSLL